MTYMISIFLFLLFFSLPQSPVTVMYPDKQTVIHQVHSCQPLTHNNNALEPNTVSNKTVSIRNILHCFNPFALQTDILKGLSQQWGV